MGSGWTLANIMVSLDRNTATPYVDVGLPMQPTQGRHTDDWAAAVRRVVERDGARCRCTILTQSSLAYGDLVPGNPHDKSSDRDEHGTWSGIV
jgi:hypothetical protein